jgi:hypothetical protein
MSWRAVDCEHRDACSTFCAVRSDGLSTAFGALLHWLTELSHTNLVSP